MAGIGWCLQSPVYTIRLDDFDVAGDDMVEFLFVEPSFKIQDHL